MTLETTIEAAEAQARVETDAVTRQVEELAKDAGELRDQCLRLTALKPEAERMRTLRAILQAWVTDGMKDEAPSVNGERVGAVTVS